MKRIFNTTGTCIPGRHFVADVTAKVDQVMEMAARGDYFTINRPRQYGKTTIMHHLFLAMHKNKDYLPLDISFEGMGASTYASAERFIPAVLDLLSMRLEFMDDYLDRQNQSRGYLLVYDLRKETGKQGEREKIDQQGKEIYAAWV